MAETAVMILSIIITNYNYERYVGSAIASALALDYRPKQIIIVDDGSTDGSRDVIIKFARENPKVIRVIFKDNGGLSSAINAGFSEATGDLVYTLDADDLVNPDMMKEVVRVFRPGVTKVQFFLEIIDANDNFVWFNEPTMSSPEEVRRSVLLTGVYLTPTTSGNIYSADYLRKVMPIRPEQMWADAYLNLLAPLYGDVISLADLRRPLGRYRMHDRNMQSTDALDITPAQRKHIEQTELRDRVMEEHCQKLGLLIEPGFKDRDYNALSRRLVSRRLRPDLHPIIGDRLLDLTYKGMKAVAYAEGFRPSQKLVIAVWLMVIAFGPKRLSWELARMRFIPGHRPRWLIPLLRVVGAARGTKVGVLKR